MACATESSHNFGSVGDTDMKDRASRPAAALSDFHLLRRLGEGSYSHVVLARDKLTGEEYALKVVNRQLVLRHNAARYIQAEHNIMESLCHPGIVQLYFTFQDADHIFFGLEPCMKGELYDQLRQRGALPEKAACFYAAEVVLILEYLRAHKVVHRDIKPENLLLDARGHLKLIDFGSAKRLAEDGSPVLENGGQKHNNQQASQSCGSKDVEGGDGQVRRRAASLIGTAEYVAPEVLRQEEVGYAADYWAVGCVLCQMLSGRLPFTGDTQYLTFHKIMKGEFDMPEFATSAARHLLSGLLQQDPWQRLGAHSIEDIKQHPFFAGINWSTLRSQPAPPLLPPRPTSAMRPLQHGRHPAWGHSQRCKPQAQRGPWAAGGLSDNEDRLF